MIRRNLILPATVAMSVALISSEALAASPQRDMSKAFNADHSSGDSLKHPLGDKQSALKARAIQAKINGDASGKVHEVAKGQYVELERVGEDLIWTVMGEFGDTPSWHAGGDPGPQHNQIPEPDRAFDNTTIWQPDFNRDYYMDLLFSDAPGAVSMRNYYIEQSSNRYAVDGDVTDWGQVEFNTAHYGTFDSTVWWFVDESVDDWYNRMVADGWNAADFDDYLSQFDVWDRYDYDGDGDFDEPDGYIDHFQALHAGEGEETGGGAY